MSRLPIPGGDDGSWGDILNDFLSQSLNNDGSLKLGPAITDAQSKADTAVQSVNGKTGTSVSLTAADVGAPTTLAAQADVSVTGVSNNQVLSYDTGSSKWIPATVSSSTVGDATPSSKGIIQLAGDLGGTAAAPTVPGLANKVGSVTAADGTIVVGGTVTAPTVKVGTIAESAVTNLVADLGNTEKIANKGQANGYAPLNGSSLVPVANLPDAASLGAIPISAFMAKGDVLAGNGVGSYTNLGVGSNGQVLTADSTASSGLSWATLPSAPVTSVAGKTGAVTLAENDITNLVTDLGNTEKIANKGQANGYAGLDSGSKVPIANLPTGTTSTTVAAGNDSRFAGSAAGTSGASLSATDATTTNSRTPTGSAGGDLSGTYPSPGVAKINGTSLAGLATGILKNTTTTGVPTIAVSGADYAPATSGSGILKGNGAGGFSTALADTDYTTPTGTETLSNKRIVPRTGSVSSSATPSINTDNVDLFSITALAVAITSMTTNLTGTPNNGDKLLIRIKDNGSAQTITWGSSFKSSGVATLLATTVSGKQHTVGLIWDAVASAWVCMAVDGTGY